MTPASAVAGSAGTTITLSGSGFVLSSQARWNGQARSTTYVDASTLQMFVTATDLQTSGAYPITVVNPTPGGGTSNALNFSISISRHEHADTDDHSDQRPRAEFDLNAPHYVTGGKCRARYCFDWHEF